MCLRKQKHQQCWNVSKVSTVVSASLLGMDVFFEFGTNPVEVRPKRGYLSICTVSKNNKPSLFSPFVSAQSPELVRAVAA